MIKVETLRLRGLCASSLLALAACSGTMSSSSSSTTNQSQVLGEATPLAADGLPVIDRQDPQDPQGRPSTQALLQGALQNARRSMEARLFEDARNEAAFALELDNQNAEAREILRRCNEVLGDRVATVGGRFADEILRNRIAAERDRTLVERELEQANAHMQQGTYGRALENYQRALATLRLSPHFQPNDPLLRRAE
ncbi:MAG: hypothetical protein ABL997_21570, partial [Planctomycetota bacterium]